MADRYAEMEHFDCNNFDIYLFRRGSLYTVAINSIAKDFDYKTELLSINANHPTMFLEKSLYVGSGNGNQTAKNTIYEMRYTFKDLVSEFKKAMEAN